MFYIYAGTTPDSTPVVVRHTRDIVDDIVRNGVTDHELEVAKNAFEGATVINLEDTGSRMARLGTSVLAHGSVTPLDRYLSSVRKVSRRDTQHRGGEDLRQHSDSRRRRSCQRPRRSLVTDAFRLARADVTEGKRRWCGPRSSIRVRS